MNDCIAAWNGLFEKFSIPQVSFDLNQTRMVFHRIQNLIPKDKKVQHLDTEASAQEFWNQHSSDVTSAARNQDSLDLIHRIGF